MVSNKIKHKATKRNKTCWETNKIYEQNRHKIHAFIKQKQNKTKKQIKYNQMEQN